MDVCISSYFEWKHIPWTKNIEDIHDPDSDDGHYSKQYQKQSYPHCPSRERKFVNFALKYKLKECSVELHLTNRHNQTIRR